MRTILKGVVILCVLTMALAVMPVSKAIAADTELFVHKSPDFTLTVPKDWIKSDKSPFSDCLLRKALNPMETTVLDVVVSNLPEGKAYKDLAKDLIDILKDKYQASNCQTLYEREIKLKDGTPAYEHPLILIFTYELVVFKDKKMIFVTVSEPNQVSDQLKQFPLSLTLK
jgi:hypothetical protein